MVSVPNEFFNENTHNFVLFNALQTPSFSIFGALFDLIYHLNPFSGHLPMLKSNYPPIKAQNESENGLIDNVDVEWREYFVYLWRSWPYLLFHTIATQVLKKLGAQKVSQSE